jgi:hypothetical protein
MCQIVNLDYGFCVGSDIVQDMEGSIHESNGFDTYEEDFESEATKVEVGDNFVVLLDELEKNDPFYVLLSGKPLHQ